MSRKDRHKKARRKRELARGNGGTRPIAASPQSRRYVPLRYEITFDQVEDLSKTKPELFRALHDAPDDVYDMLHERRREVLPLLERLVERFPNEPMLLNWLSSAYTMTGDDAAAERMAVRNFEQNPDYLFARTDLAQIYLLRGEVEKAGKIFGGKFDLKVMYPDRDRFHITEFMSFSHVACLYLVSSGNPEPAKVIFRAMEKLAPDHEATRAIRRAIYSSRLALLARKMLSLMGPGRKAKRDT